MKRTILCSIALLVPCCSAFAAEEAVFVQSGNARSVREIGDKRVTKEAPKAAASVEKTLLFEAGEDGYAVFRIPGIVVTTRGTVLAYCVGRKTPGDWADIDIFLRRSTDGGTTWEPRKKLGDMGASTVDNPTAIVDRKTGAIHMLYQIDYARAFYVRSDDDGRTFSDPVEITSVFEQFRQEYDWNVIAPGPGHGIQLNNRRLVVPVWLSTGGRRHRPSIVSVIYSDDHGTTWHRGDVVVRTDEEFIDPRETVAVELTDNRVMLNISDLAVGPDGSVYCLYERGGLGGNHYHTEGVTVAKFSLRWLTDGRDTLTPGGS